MRRRSHRWLALVLAGAVSGCVNISQLQFKADDRLHFTSPKAYSEVSLPLTVAWTMHDFTVVPDGTEPTSRSEGHFAVFLDRSPIRPGQTLEALARNDRSCARTPGCPDLAYLAGLRVYPTSETELTLDSVPPIAGDTHKVQSHFLTVVLLDSTGHRIGETAWSLRFKVSRRDVS